MANSKKKWNRPRNRLLYAANEESFSAQPLVQDQIEHVKPLDSKPMNQQFINRDSRFPRQ
ncbi:MAG: hypothetical protein OEY29_15970 [Gammaproteobacteria bacterium]|nr:hypothetical protein [Gammaproteobacteria bacterium]